MARANAAQADLIAITGDIADGDPEKLWRDAEPLKDLRAKDGVYCVTGNHEYYGPWEKWSVCFSLWGMRFLSNECVFPREGLALGGVNDIRAWMCGADCPDVAAAFAAATNGEFRVLLEHLPGNVLTNVREGDVRLQLSGHTHGGIMPGLSWLVKMHNGGYVRGVYRAPGRSGDRYLYVAPGAGQWAGFPVRFFNSSELSLVILRKVQ